MSWLLSWNTRNRGPFFWRSETRSWIRFLRSFLLTYSLVPKLYFWNKNESETDSAITNDGASYVSMVRNVSVGVILSLVNDEVPLLLDLLSILPSYQAPAKFRDKGRVSVPGLKVTSTPHTGFVGIESADKLEPLPPGLENRVGPFQTFIRLFNFLAASSWISTAIYPLYMYLICVPWETFWDRPRLRNKQATRFSNLIRSKDNQSMESVSRFLSTLWQITRLWCIPPERKKTRDGIQNFVTFLFNI